MDGRCDLSRRPCERREQAVKTARGTAPRSANRFCRRFAFEMALESFASLSCGRRGRCVVFFAAWREKATGLLFTERESPSSMQENPYYTTRRRHDLTGAFRCEMPRRDLRRLASYSASLRLLAQSRTRSAFATLAHSSLSNPRRCQLLSTFSPCAAPKGGCSRLRGHELPLEWSLRIASGAGAEFRKERRGGRVDTRCILPRAVRSGAGGFHQ